MISALTKSRRNITTRASSFFLLLTLACSLACNRAGEQATPRPTPVSPFERGVAAARKQLAKNIFAISRSDNGELTSDDLAYIRNNVPLDRVYSGLTDDRRYVIVSMHIEFPADKLATLQQRFTVAQVQT